MPRRHLEYSSHFILRSLDETRLAACKTLRFKYSTKREEKQKPQRVFGEKTRKKKRVNRLSEVKSKMAAA